MKYQYGVLQRRNCAKRFGTAAMCGAVLVGLSPVVVNAAFAESMAGDKKTIDVKLENKPATDASLTEELKKRAGTQIEVTPKDSQTNCPTLAVEGNPTKDRDGDAYVFTDKLGFTENKSENPTEDTTCTYIITLQNQDEGDTLKLDKSAYRLEWKYTPGAGTEDTQKQQGTWESKLRKFDNKAEAEAANSGNEGTVADAAYFQSFFKYWQIEFARGEHSTPLAKEIVPNGKNITKVPATGQCEDTEVFAGWQLNGSGKLISSEELKTDAYKPSGWVVYKSSCILPHTVKFYKEGTTVSAGSPSNSVLHTATIKHGTPMLENDFPQYASTACKNGGTDEKIYGWKQFGEDDSAAKTKIELTKPAAKVTQDMSYVTVCKPIVRVTVTLDANGGTLSDSSRQANAVESGTVFAQPANPTPPVGKLGSKFLFWTADGATGTKKYDFTSAVNGNITLTAIYGYTVTYKKAADHADADKVIGVEDIVAGGDATGIATKGAKTINVANQLDSYCKATDVFKEWTVEGGVNPIEKDALPAMVNKNLTLTAKCEPKPVSPPAPPAPSVPPTPQPSPSVSGGSGGGYSGSYFPPSASPSSSASADKGKEKEKPAAKKPDTKKPAVKKPTETKFDKMFKTPVKLAKEAVTRAAGGNRVDTSLQVLSQVKNHDTVVLATGSSFPDALVGGALAGAMKAGVVLTTNDTLEPAIVKQLQAQGTKTIQIVGGYGAISAAKEAALKAAGFQVTRLAGSDRYETAKMVKAATRSALGLKGNAKAKVSCNATGSNFPDALACASAASLTGGVVDLVKPGSAVTADASAETTICAGGAACAAAGHGVNKVVGSDRYETAYKIAELTPATGKVVVSNASNAAADALVAGALSASTNARLILSDGKRVNLPAGTKNAHLVGGTQALPNNIPMFTR
ncbi:cell wall-binding repeat-containing protein [Mobiluncus mulieris]|uniref:Cell wall-binding repeat-containing protein n=1 Tax=Mobiluncus mulieris TaxID=2052 RepID=A0A7Y0YHP3_9ACTO|nr:cell wall-binding repeat-containing protein [Mobiluncus mulieris]NMX03270.1 cell wall-binding repeat-containing protein [Mobiluncus mulieris]